MRNQWKETFYNRGGGGGGLALILSLWEGGGVEINFCFLRGEV